MTYLLPKSACRKPTRKELKQALGLEESPQERKNRRNKAWEEFQERLAADHPRRERC